MCTNPYIAEVVATERCERMLRHANEWRLFQELKKNRSSRPLPDVFRALCGLARHFADWARGWQPQRPIEQH